jgi:hypothetical protein
VDSQSLSAEEVQELQTRVARARGQGAESPRARRPALPDELSALITIEDEHGRETIRAPESQLSSSQRELIDWVTTSPKSQRDLRAPGNP